MPLAISRSLIDAVMADCMRDSAHERCGLLLGRGSEVLEVAPVANAASDAATRFEIAPDVLIAAARAAREQGLALVGHYHSHPDGAARPSARDAAAAAGDGGRYWMIVAAGRISAWRFTGKGSVHGFAPVPLAITGAAT